MSSRAACAWSVKGVRITFCPSHYFHAAARCLRAFAGGGGWFAKIRCTTEFCYKYRLFASELYVWGGYVRSVSSSRRAPCDYRMVRASCQLGHTPVTHVLLCALDNKEGRPHVQEAPHLQNASWRVGNLRQALLLNTAFMTGSIACAERWCGRHRPSAAPARTCLGIPHIGAGLGWKRIPPCTGGTLPSPLHTICSGISRLVSTQPLYRSATHQQSSANGDTSCSDSTRCAHPFRKPANHAPAGAKRPGGHAEQGASPKAPT